MLKSKKRNQGTTGRTTEVKPILPIFSFFKPAGFIGFHTVTDNGGSAGGTNHRDGVEAGAVAES